MDNKSIVGMILAELRSSYDFLYIGSTLYAKVDNVYLPTDTYKLTNMVILRLGALGLFETDLTSKVRYEVMELLKAKARISFQEFEKRDNKDYTAFENGYVNMHEAATTGRITLHPFAEDPDNLFFYQIPHKLRPAEGSAIEFLKQYPFLYSFISSLVGERGALLQLQKIGYCLWRRMPYKNLFIEYGGSDAGKTTFMNLLTFILGKENISTVPVKDLADGRFSRSDLYGKFANLSDEVPQAAITNQETLKAITGDSLLYSDRKYLGSISFYSYATPIFSANALPHLKNKDDDTFFKRVIVTNYPNHFSQNEEFKRQLMTDENAEILITASLLSLKSLYEAGGFSSAALDVKNIWLQEEDSVYRFIERTKASGELAVDKSDPHSFIVSDDLYSWYAMFMSAEEEQPVLKNTFTIRLANRYGITKSERMAGRIKQYCYVGIQRVEKPTGTLKTPSERTESNLREQAPAPQPKLCRVCRSSTSTLIHDPRSEGGFICIDCLNEYQRRNEEE